MNGFQTQRVQRGNPPVPVIGRAAKTVVNGVDRRPDSALWERY